MSTLIAPGGAWIDHSVYQIGLLRWLLDDEVSEVMGRVRRLKYPDLAVEDYGIGTLEFSRRRGDHREHLDRSARRLSLQYESGRYGRGRHL